MPINSAVVLGASGQVGKALVNHLLSSPNLKSLTLVGRRELKDIQDSRVKQEIIEMNAENLEKLAPKFAGIEAGFCTMGVGKASKVSREELELVDVTLPTAFAKALKEANVQHVGLLTAVGADVTAKPSALTGTAAGGGLYAHLKGKVEENYKQLGFPSLAIYHPSTILGNANTPGAWEWIAVKIDCVMPTRFKAIHTNDLGKAMVIAAEKGTAGCTTYEGQSLFDLYGSQQPAAAAAASN